MKKTFRFAGQAGRTRAERWKLLPKPRLILLLTLAACALWSGNLPRAHAASSEPLKLDTVTVTLEAPAGLEFTQDADGFDSVRLPGYANVASPGNPALPQKIYDVALPPDADWTDLEVRVVGIDLDKVPGTYQIAPAPPAAGWHDSAHIVDWMGAEGTVLAGKNLAVYGEDVQVPGSLVELAGLAQKREIKYARIAHSPVQWNPSTGTLTLANRVELDLVFHRTPDEGNDQHQDAAALEVSQLPSLINAEEARGWYETGEESASLGVQQVHDYAIITTNAIEAGSTQLASFVAHKESMGHMPVVVTEDEYGGLVGQAPNGTAEKIRQWLIDNYALQGIQYALLIGNPHPESGDVPMKKCWPRYGESTYRESPTDYFYADLTGNWDLNGDGIFGDYASDGEAGGVDFANEVFVGRIPVYNAEYGTLDSILQKIVDYENEIGDTSWRSSALLPMSFSDASTDGAYLADYMINDYLAGSGYSAYTLYQHKTTGCSSTFSSSEDLVGGATASHWAAEDYGLVTWWGHGNSSGAYIGYGTDCSDGLILNSSGAPALNDDRPAFTYQCSCTNGYPENSSNLGYALLKNGAIGTVTASRVSWYAVTSWRPSLKYYADNASLGYYYGEHLVANEPAGHALFHVKADLGQNLYSAWGGSSWMNLMDFNLYGDPSTAMQRDLTTWNGKHGTAWADSRNWDSGEVPGPDDNVVVPGGVPDWPTVDGSAAVENLAILEGAVVTAAANAVLEVYGNWSIEQNAQFTGTASTVILRGEGPQLLTSDGSLELHHLQIGDGASASSALFHGVVVVAGDLVVREGASLGMGLSTVDVRGNLTLQAASSLTAGWSAVQVAGNLTLEEGSSFDAEGSSWWLSGDWTDAGASVRPGTSTVVLNGSAQTIKSRSEPLLGTEAFDGPFPPSGWTRHDNTGSGRNWELNTTLGIPNYTNGTGNSAVSRTNQASNSVAWDNELRSPQITVLHDSALLTYESNFQDYAGNGDAWLDVSTDGGVSWSNEQHWTMDYGPTFEQVDLGAYTGQTIILRWRYAAGPTDAWYWQIDDITLSVTEGWDGEIEFFDLTVGSNATFLGDLSVLDDLSVEAGAVVDVGAHGIVGVGGTLVNSGALRQMRDVGDGVTMPFLRVQGGKYYGLDITPSTGNMGETMVTVYGNQACPEVPSGINRCFEISPGEAQTAAITFYYRDAEENGQDSASAWHWNGSDWDPLPSTRDRSGVEDNWVRASDVTDYSPFALANDLPTAVELSRFSAESNGGAIEVRWETLSEVLIRGFNLKRRTAHDDAYLQLNELLIPSRVPGSPLGNEYRWEDLSVELGASYEYLLELVDIEGMVTPYGPVPASLGGTSYRLYLPLVSRP